MERTEGERAMPAAGGEGEDLWTVIVGRGIGADAAGTGPDDDAKRRRRKGAPQRATK